MATTYRFRFRVRRRTTANWVSSNEVLLDSEIGRESDGLHRLKMGDGVTGWNALPFMTPGLFDATALAGIADGDALLWDAGLGLFVPGPAGGGPVAAADVTFDATTANGSSADNVQDAIDETIARIDQASLGGILIQGGSKDLLIALTTAFYVDGIAAASYEISGWEMLVEPSGSLSIDLRKASSIGGTPASITPSGKPTVTSGTNATGGTSGWTTTTISRSDYLVASVASVAAVKRFSLLLKGIRA